MGKTRIRLSNAMSAEEAAELLSHIALGIATGEIWIENDDRHELLHPGSPIRVEIKGGEDREGGKLAIEVSWKSTLRIYGLSPGNGDGQKETRKNGKR